MNKTLSLLPAAMMSVACAASQPPPPPATPAELSPTVVPSTIAIEAVTPGDIATLPPVPPPPAVPEIAVPRSAPVASQSWFAGDDSLVYEAPGGWADKQCHDGVSYTCVEFSQGKKTVQIKLRPAADGLPLAQCESIAAKRVGDAKNSKIVVTEQSAHSARVTWQAGKQSGFVACDSLAPPRPHLVRVVEGMWPTTQNQGMAKAAMNMATKVIVK